MFRKSVVPCALSILCFILPLAAGEELQEEVVLRPHVYGHFQSGQIVNGSLKYDDRSYWGHVQDDYTIRHFWHEDAIIEGGLDAIYRERLKMTFTLGSKLYFSYPLLVNEKYTKNTRQSVYIGDLYAQYHIGDLAMPYFLGQVGYFRYKYNPECRNFGDYMFRTGTYPVWFDMSFDAPWQRLLGLHGQTNVFKSLKLDVLLISSTVHPTMNWSLAGLADYDVAGLHFVTIGAGVDFAHLFSVYNKNTYPFFGGDITTPSTSQTNFRYLDNMRIENGTDTLFDTCYYTFKGTKVMGRIAIDPKALLPKELTVFGLSFGPNDLKLYAEADLIGYTNYPDTGISQANQKQLVAPSYNDRWERMPVAVGFNFPAFRLLDVLNAECEWFGARYMNDASNLMNKGDQPLPYNVVFWGQPGEPKKAFLKWSLYAKKSFANGHFAITGQIGRDHLVLPCAAFAFEQWNEFLVEADDWGWYLKTSWYY